MKNILLFVLLIFYSGLSFPQDKKFDSLINVGIKQIYGIKFSDAEKTFRFLMTDYPDHPSGRFYLAMVDWWRILLDLDNEAYDDMFYKKLEDVIFQCEELLKHNENNVDALFYKGGAIGFRGRLRALRDSWLKAVDDGREALPIVQKAARLSPGNKDVELGFGIYNYYASVIPDKYPLIKPLMIFFPKGDKDKGITQLTATASEGKYAKYEARYFLMQLYYQFENNIPKSKEFASLLYNDFPDNPNFERWYGRICVSMGENYPAVFRSVYAKCLNQTPGYDIKAGREASYYIGVYYKDKGIPDSAKIYLSISEEKSRLIDKDKASGFLINTVLYLGNINDLLNNRQEAIRYYNEALDMREYGQSRVLAKQYLEKPYAR